MFEIEYKGANSVVLSTKKSKIVIDPNISSFGLKNPSVLDSVQIATESRFLIDDDKSKIVICGAGEYGIDNFDIRGIAARRHIDSDQEPKNSTIYRIEIEDARIGVIGNIWSKLNDEQLEMLGLIDILILPVGGNGYTMDAKSAASLVSSINPKVIVPVHYKDSAIKYEVPQDDLSDFVKELSADVEAIAKYKLKNVASLPVKTTIIHLDRQ